MREVLRKHDDIALGDEYIYFTSNYRRSYIEGDTNMKIKVYTRSLLYNLFEHNSNQMASQSSDPPPSLSLEELITLIELATTLPAPPLPAGAVGL